MKLKDTFKEVLKVLLLCLLKNKEAKLVYVLINSNSNFKGFTIIIFESQEKLEKAKSKLLRYNNSIVF